MKTYKLSPSKLNLMEDCPRCFWLHVKKNVQRPRGAFPSLPSGMDKVLKAHFDSFRNKNKLPPELEYEKVKAKLFKNAELLKIWRNNRKGVEWKDSKGNILMGAVDEILQKGKKLIVLDYKTRGFPLKENTAEHYQNQLNIYNFLLRKNGFKTEDYGYLLFYMPQKVNEIGNFVFDIDLVKMGINVKDGERLFKKAIKILNSRMPKPSKDCEFCKWLEKVK